MRADSTLDFPPPWPNLPRFFFPDCDIDGDGTAKPSTICIGDRARIALGVLRRNTDGEKFTPPGAFMADAPVRIWNGELSKRS